MKKIIWVNGKLFGHNLETLNVLLVNKKITGLGYLPDDEENTTIHDLDGAWIVPNLSTLSQNRSATTGFQHVFHLQDLPKNKSILIPEQNKIQDVLKQVPKNKTLLCIRDINHVQTLFDITPNPGLHLCISVESMLRLSKSEQCQLIGTNRIHSLFSSTLNVDFVQAFLVTLNGHVPQDRLCQLVSTNLTHFFDAPTKGLALLHKPCFSVLDPKAKTNTLRFCVRHGDILYNQGSDSKSN